MRRVIFALILVILAGTASADVFDDALSKAGLNKQTARFDPLDLKMYGGDDYKLPYFDEYHSDPWRTPERVKLFRQQVAGASSKSFDMVAMASSLLGSTVRRSLLGDPAAEFEKKSGAKDALADSILTLWQASGKKPKAGYEEKLKTDASQVPSEVAVPAAMVLYAEADALKWRSLAFRRLSEKYDLQTLYDHILISGQGDYDFIREDMMSKTDLMFLFTGAEDLAAAIDKASTALSKVQNTNISRFEADTPVGKVVISGSEDNTYPAGTPYALIIDIGGNDTYYSGAATTSADACVSVLFDLSGDDKYLETPELAGTAVEDFTGRKGWKSGPNTCAAMMGYAFLIDLQGNDRYCSINNCQGWSAYGVAVLMDNAGNDYYNCYQSGQGSATFGFAALADGSGNDNYRCFTTSQGFGAVKGFGLLVDRSGDDTYTADNTHIDFPSAQDAKHNGNLAQGAGFGERADYTNGHSFAGGVGALVDLTGDDTYVSDIMAQGMGYWYGLGILTDAEGNDSYTGYWYNQGSAAHFAVGILDDAAGNDKYVGPCSMVMGAGHDFSLGFLIDEGGNDSYEAAGISLGAGNANGIGVFWDVAGDDIYETTGRPTLGRVNLGSRGSSRDYDICLGLFLDTGGSDTFPNACPYAKDGKTWLQSEDTKNMLPTEVGIGMAVGH